METASTGRTDRASRFIRAPAQRIYAAFVDPAALVSWLPPRGMRATLASFDARAGGKYRMVLTYEEAAGEARGKSSDRTDVVDGEFVELAEGERIVQLVRFDSEDPAYAGAMKLTWSLAPSAGGTEVTITCENVPDAISAEDHRVGLSSSLESLAAFTE